MATKTLTPWQQALVCFASLEGLEAQGACKSLPLAEIGEKIVRLLIGQNLAVLTEKTGLCNQIMLCSPRYAGTHRLAKVISLKPGKRVDEIFKEATGFERVFLTGHGWDLAKMLREEILEGGGEHEAF